eukprot:GHVS01100678.1.p1 GENE.GHVS01100678.1~~GHVS01100678.1.p1  ORF type:complete len:1964 (+),score=383.61 GHVS01100678.1:686-6577(+)
MARGGGSKWCALCRDDCGKEDFIGCVLCKKKFHVFCLHQDGQISSDDLLDPDTWLCATCSIEEDQPAVDNDEKCRLCREEQKEEHDLLVLCDGCPNSYHMSCLGLSAEPDVDKWYCPECRPQDHQIEDVRRLGNRGPKMEGLGGGGEANSTSCYVCQQPGKLLGCDTCVRSFHPSCLPDVEFDNIVDKWECPVCKGDDPLDRMHTKFKRMNFRQRQEMKKKREKAIQQMRAKCSRYRNRFTLTNADALKPFVDAKIFDNIRKKFKEFHGNDKKKTTHRLKQREQNEDQRKLQQLEAETEKEIMGFVNRCYTKCNQIRSRQMRGPLREGISLKNYQEDGVEWLIRSFLKGGGILADEMGLGKTIQTLCFLSYLKAGGVEGPHLVVVPLSTVGNWLREVHKFTPNLTTIKICGSKLEREHAMKDTLANTGLYDLYVTTYETVKTEEAFFTDTVTHWQCVVLDEAHRIKNQSGAMRHSLDRVRGNMRLLLTGTPLQNNAQELFTLINFMLPELFGPKTTAMVESAFMGTSAGSSAPAGGRAQKRGNGVMPLASEIDPAHIAAVRGLLETIMLRRVKEQAVVLPRKIVHDIWLPISSTSGAWYRRLLDLSSMQSEDTSVRKLLGIVIKLRIICCHPKGVVSRRSQQERLQQAFAEESAEVQAAVSEAAQELQKKTGEESIRASAKVTFLDRLLCQLHYVNLKNIPDYKRHYWAHRHQVVTRKIHAQQEEKAQREERPVERMAEKNLVASELYNKMIQDGAPTEDATAHAEDYLRNGMFAVQNLAAAPYKNRWELEKIAKDAEEEEMVKRRSRKYLDSDEEDSKRKGEDDKMNTDGSNLDVEGGDGGGEEGGGERREEVKRAADGGGKVVEAVGQKEEDGARSEANGELKGEKDDDEAKGVAQANAFAPPSVPSVSKVELEPKMHKVLIFTQFQLILDELAEYCDYRGWRYLRLDGSTNKLIRELDIREFNLQDSTHFVYLISTRAGGLGINLVTANNVVLFDEDWNPFVDLQAIDRAHRIGQKRDVHIWKLMTEWTVEERMAFRREQKLKLDKMLIQANEELLAIDGEEAEAPEEKLSAEEVRKLLLHGRRAMQNIRVADDQFDGMMLEDFVERQRRPLPEAEEEAENEEPALEEEEEDEAGDMVNVDEVMHDEVDEVKLTQVSSPGGSDEDMEPREEKVDSTEPNNNKFLELADMQDVAEVKESPANAKSRLVAELETAGALWRSGRVRKKPTNVYVPATWGQQEMRKKLTYETKCFVCSKGRNVKTKYVDGSGKEVEIDYGELVGCARCPKAYHKICEGIKEEKRTWTCRWHECCLCFRKASQCGNLLIHCARCPCSFCYDCFPPDYTRFHVGEDYYHQLRQRGGTMKPSNWIMFLCARCKAIEEQSKRQVMTKTELEDQRSKQKELRSQLLDVSKDARNLHNQQQLRITSRRIEVDTKETMLEGELREVYEKLFPDELTSTLRELKAKADSERIAARSSTVHTTSTVAGSTAPEGQDKKKATIPRIMMPRELLKLCTNCRLPGHLTVEQCPFPLESVVARAPLSVAQIEFESNGRPSVKWEEGGQVALHNRGFCALCGSGQKGRLGHSRRHCDMLTEEQKLQYEERYNRYRQFTARVSRLKKIQLGVGVGVDCDQSIGYTRTVCNGVCAKIAHMLKDALEDVGLGRCSAPVGVEGRGQSLLTLSNHIRPPSSICPKGSASDSPVTISSTNTPPSEPTSPSRLKPPQSTTSKSTTDNRRIPKAKPPPAPPTPPQRGSSSRRHDDEDSGEDVEEEDEEESDSGDERSGGGGRRSASRKRPLSPHYRRHSPGVSPGKRRMMQDDLRRGHHLSHPSYLYPVPPYMAPPHVRAYHEHRASSGHSPAPMYKKNDIRHYLPHPPPPPPPPAPPGYYHHHHHAHHHQSPPQQRADRHYHHHPAHRSGRPSLHGRQDSPPRQSQWDEGRRHGSSNGSVRGGRKGMQEDSDGSA